MANDNIAELTVRELIGRIVQEQKKRSGTITPEFRDYVIERELPEISSRISRRLTVKRLHKLEGQFLGMGKKTPRKSAGGRRDDRGGNAAVNTAPEVQS